MLDLRVINNGDHAGLVWFPNDGLRIAACRGFGIQKRSTGGAGTETTWLSNFHGLGPSAAAPANGEEWRWPFQRYFWWDYHVAPGDRVSYRIVPVVGPDRDHLEVSETAASAWCVETAIDSQDGRAIEAYFNRGIIAGQWVARELADLVAKNAAAAAKTGGPRTTLKGAIETRDGSLRKGLGGLLLPKLIDLLKTAPGNVYAALYELGDQEIIDAIAGLGNRCALILGNGAFKPPLNDENHDVRLSLHAADQISLSDRMVGSPHFAHNKFFVFCDAAGAAQTVWTGSTNCTETGLCTQANNGILIKDPQVADAYLQAWQRLKDAGNGYPPTLAITNSAQRTFDVANDTGGTSPLSVWFAPTAHGEDMAQARTLVNQAKDGILFLFFNPGHFSPRPADWTLLQTILNRHAPAPNPDLDANLYIRGVVNQEVAGLTKPKTPPPGSSPLDPALHAKPVALFDSGRASERLPAEVLVPNAIRDHFGEWQTELEGMSNVMIHSKVVVIDPFGEHPVVMTGSHNLGMKASQKNDDNLVIVEGNAALAQAYALNVIAIFQSYRWRQYVASRTADPSHPAWDGPQDNDTWQDGHLKTDAAEMKFWLKELEPE